MMNNPSHQTNVDPPRGRSVIAESFRPSIHSNGVGDDRRRTMGLYFPEEFNQDVRPSTYNYKIDELPLFSCSVQPKRSSWMITDWEEFEKVTMENDIEETKYSDEDGNNECNHNIINIREVRKTSNCVGIRRGSIHESILIEDEPLDMSSKEAMYSQLSLEAILCVKAKNDCVRK